MRYTSKEIERVLGTLDPTGDGHPPATAQRAALDRAAIMSGGGPAARRKPARRRMVLAGAGVAAVGAVAAVVVGSLLVESVGPDAPAAYAATPDPLVYTAPAGKASAAGQLERIAARTERLPAERSTGSEHLKMSAWYLNIAVAGQQVTSLVVPMWTETWRAADGTGTMTTGFSRPELRTGEDREKWERLGRPGDDSTPSTETLQPTTPREFDGPAPADRDALARYLAQGHPPENGPGETIAAITGLARDRVLAPAQRAALLRVLATVPGLTYAGGTTDRAGRKGEAFTLRNRHGGLLNDQTLVVDPASGRLLDSEVLLLERGKLDVRVPGVIQYELYLTSEFADR